MNDAHIKTLDEVRLLLAGIGAVDLVIDTQEDRTVWIQKTLIRFRYRQLGKVHKGLLLSFLQKISGYSRIQIKRLVRRSLKTGKLQRRPRTVNGFACRYTREDIRLLAYTDELHATLSGPATKKLCERAYTIFGQTEYQRLAGISVGPSTTYDTVPPTVPYAVTSRRPTPVPLALVNVAHRSLRASQVICAWIRCTRAI